jgi:farnesyl-diphosphate farnesyltransferase
MEPERKELKPTADLDDLLVKSSRTFALSIPLLPEPTRREVTVAYLLFRIADTFEDAARWPREERCRALEDFIRLLHDPDGEEVARLTTAWRATPPIDHAGYLELLEATPSVLEAFAALSPAARHQVRLHTERTAEGMADFVSRGTPEGSLLLTTLADLRAYCYVVAGIVGEMLTELFIIGHRSLEPMARDLRQRAAAFGEGLQLVNILKDSEADGSEGRIYVPRSVPRQTLFSLAREDLDRAAEYTTIIQEAHSPRGVVAFNALPILLARATLDHVELAGPGAKITRNEVFEIVTRLNADLDAGRPAVVVA